MTFRKPKQSDPTYADEIISDRLMAQAIDLDIELARVTQTGTIREARKSVMDTVRTIIRAKAWNA
jgi:post-segregation antitoxin (ccd killing protein)